MSIKTETRSLRCSYSVIRAASVVKLIAGSAQKMHSWSFRVCREEENNPTLFFFFLAKQKKRKITKTVWIIALFLQLFYNYFNLEIKIIVK